MSDSVAVTETPPPGKLVPSSAAYLVNSEDDDDTDDIIPNLDRVQASGKDGRFYDRSNDDKVSMGERLRVVLVHAAPSQTGWVPKHDPSKGRPPHPDLEFFTALGIDTEKPYCKNMDVKRQAPRPSEDLTPKQLQGLKARGWTGSCHGCPFKKWNREAKTAACREGREVLMMLPDRDMPVRMTVDGTSLSPFKRYLKTEFEARVEGKLVKLMPFSKVTNLSFKSEKNDFGDNFVLVPEASSTFLPEDQVANYRQMRETYLLYTLEEEPHQYVDEPADYEIPASETKANPVSEGAPPLSDADAPVEQTSEGVAKKYF